MEFLEKIVTGQIHISEFVDRFKTDITLQDELRNLMPPDAINNPEHEIWKKMSYDTLKTYNFDIVEFMIGMRKFDDNSGADLNIHSELAYFYCYVHPDVVPTKKYYEDFLMYIDFVMDTYEGPEVDDFTKGLFEKIKTIEGKTKRKKEGKKLIREAFHVDDPRYRPYWIQSGDWPMGENSPMKYDRKVRRGECVEYYFHDVDTGEVRIVEQYY